MARHPHREGNRLLSAADRCAVDEELAADTGALAGAGDRTITTAVRAAAYRRDPHTVAKRASRAVTERCVSLRPAPDTMTSLTALLPVTQGIAAYAALTRHADTVKSAGVKSAGDNRSRGAIMADALVQRITGTPGGITGIEIQLIMTDRTLLQGDSEPARLTGYGTVPAHWARKAVQGAAAGSSHPGSAASSRSATTPAAPPTDAPFRHHDHIIPRHQDGPTTSTNGQGLCEACNHTKETPGWTATPTTGEGHRHTVKLQTPTGHTYHSTAPPTAGNSTG